MLISGLRTLIVTGPAFGEQVTLSLYCCAVHRDRCDSLKVQPTATIDSDDKVVRRKGARVRPSLSSRVLRVLRTTLGQYQGEVLNKKLLQEKYLTIDSVSQDGREAQYYYDWSPMERVIEVIFEAFK